MYSELTLKENILGKGGSYAGPSIRKILRETSLTDLELMLPDEYAKPVVEYLRATRKIYELCMARHVAPDYHLHFEEFRKAFLVLRKLIKLPWTLKVHCILGIYFCFEYLSFLSIWIIFRSL